MNDAFLNSPYSQRQDQSADLTNFFNDSDALQPSSALQTPTPWDPNQMFPDYDNYNNLSFQQGPDPSFGIAPQAISNSFMLGTNPGMMALQVHNNGQQVSAGAFDGQSAAPSALFNTTNTGYNTRQAAGSQKGPSATTDRIEANVEPEPEPKKTRKGRKKRGKELTQAEIDAKRQKFLDRNKVAAHKCRQRKKEWTDNLQNRVNLLQNSVEMYKIEIANSLAEIHSLKAVVKQMHPPSSPHTDLINEKLRAIEKREANGYQDEILSHLIALRAARDADAADAENGDEGSMSMSRQSSAQSLRSGVSDRKVHSERHDSGVSNMGTPDHEAQKDAAMRKLSVDEGVDLGNNQNHYGNMMPNQRLGHMFEQPQWNPRLPTGGPVDLVDPAVYLGLSQ
ncbi:hypothetical protein EG329_005398 [Mollisiaceae sp. DMI_Dod_QoI]|nr:hypothetical protein EG329_005398 [Helotiales sp. DMI_Dod_QoI]